MCEVATHKLTKKQEIFANMIIIVLGLEILACMCMAGMYLLS